MDLEYVTMEFSFQHQFHIKQMKILEECIQTPYWHYSKCKSFASCHSWCDIFTHHSMVLCFPLSTQCMCVFEVLLVIVKHDPLRFQFGTIKTQYNWRIYPWKQFIRVVAFTFTCMTMIQLLLSMLCLRWNYHCIKCQMSGLWNSISNIWTWKPENLLFKMFKIQNGPYEMFIMDYGQWWVLCSF